MNELSEQERALIARPVRQQMLDQVLCWSAINSGSRNLPGLATMAETLRQAFAVLPGAIRLVAPAPVDAVGNDGQLTSLDHGQHLVISVRPEAPLRMLFTGHMDTVFAADHGFQQTRWLDGITLNGPGVADMKGGIAVLLAALEAVESSPLAARFGYDVLINSDEEVGSLSSAALIAELAAGKCAAFTYEPSALPDGTLAGERAGSGNFSISIVGRAAHAGRNPDEGRNAIVAAADLAMRLKAGHAPDLYVNPARIDGGGPNNIVPDLAIVRVNIRPHSAAALQRAHLLLMDASWNVTRTHDVKVTMHGSFARPPKALDAASLKLFGLVEQAGAALGLSLPRKASGGVCDGNNIAACGVPVIDTMGVRGGAIHSTDEFLLVDSLVERAQLSALAISRIITQGGL